MDPTSSQSIVWEGNRATTPPQPEPCVSTDAGRLAWQGPRARAILHDDETFCVLDVDRGILLYRNLCFGKLVAN